MRAALRKLVRLWEATQVELHGRYSYNRLRGLHSYMSAMFSVPRLVELMFVPPLPCLSIILLLDALPLAPPEEGPCANVVFWLCSGLVTVVFTFAFVTQLLFMLPSLPLTWTRLAVATAVAAVRCKLCGFGLALVIGFPVPFGMMIESTVWCWLLAGFLYPVVSRHIRQHPTHRAQLCEWLDVTAFSASLTFVYPLYNYLFVNVATLSPAAQSALALLLAVVKIAFKNAFNRIVREQPDLKAQIVNFHVEVFNALFVIFSMQSATSLSTLAVLTLVDLLHACSTFYEVRCAVQELQVLEQGLHMETTTRVDTIIERASAILAQQPTRSRMLSAVCRNRSTTSPSSNDAGNARPAAGPNVSYLQILQKFASRRKIAVLPPKQIWTATVEPRDRLQQTSVMPMSAAASSELDAGTHKRNSVGAPSSTTEDAYAAKVLELLYLTEFTVLNEYIEVIVPAVYGALSRSL